MLSYFGQSCDANAPSVWADSTFEVLIEDNVVYGAGLSHDGWGGTVIDTIALELDVYAPDNQEEGRPALVIIHGGGFFGGSNEQGIACGIVQSIRLQRLGGFFHQLPFGCQKRYSPGVVAECRPVFA